MQNFYDIIFHVNHDKQLNSGNIALLWKWHLKKKLKVIDAHDVQYPHEYI